MTGSVRGIDSLVFLGVTSLGYFARSKCEQMKQGPRTPEADIPPAKGQLNQMDQQSSGRNLHGGI